MPGVNPEQLKQQAQMLNMRGAQVASDMARQQRNQQAHYAQPSGEQDADKGGKLLARPAKGSKRQLIGTIVGIAAAVLLLAVLARVL